MPDTSASPIAFDNQLAYDVIVYDSFDNDDDDNGSSSSDSQSYFATLTQLGKIPAGTTVNLQPIRDSSTFVVENASDNKPVKRLIALSFDDITSLSIVPDDDTAMTQTFAFVSFFLNNPNDPISVAFNKVLNDTDDDLATGIDNFFASQPAYNKCDFEDYMMALAYTAQHPVVPNPSQPAGSSSLKIISDLMGSKWGDLLGDIFVTKFTITNKDKKLTLTFEVDISTLPFETAAIASNVLTLLNGTKTVKAQILFNYAIGLNIFGTRLSLLFDAMTIPIENGKTLNIKQPSASIDINPLFKFVVFTLKATFPFNVNGKTFDALADFVIDNDEAAIGVSIQGDHSTLPPPPGLKGLFFDEFGVGMALFFKPPGFGIGIQGKFHIGVPAGEPDINLDDDTFALVCEFVEEAIEPKYVAFSVPQLNLSQVVQLFTNASPNIDVPVNFTDLSFHWSDSLMDAVALPDGTLSQGGYGFSAAVDIFSFGFYGEANLDISNGLTANVEVSPINWKNIFKLEGDGKGYSLKYDTNGNPIPSNFIANTQADKDALAKAVDKQIVAPGGPSLIINTLSMPILHLNASASLFDLLNYSIKADINKSGISFELDYGSILTQQMICNLTDFHNFYGQFRYFINRSIPIPTINGVNIGSIPLNADASLHLTINTSLADVVIKTGGQFDFEGYHFSFGDFTADINISKISDFVESIIQYIKDEAKTIFAQILDTAEHWAAAAKKGIIIASDDAGKVLKDAYNKGAQETIDILKATGYTYDQIANTLKNDFGYAADVTAAYLQSLGYSAMQAIGVVKNLYFKSYQDAVNIIRNAGYLADDAAKGLQGVWASSEQDIATGFKNAGYLAQETATALKDVYNVVINDCASYLKQAGYIANDVASALQGTFNASINDVASAMKQVGYAASDVASALQHAFNTSVDAVAGAMKQVGYAANDVKNAFESLGGDFKNFADSAWKTLSDPDTWNPSKW